MSEIKLYDTEARMELVMNSGPRHYTAHVNHMTTEDLRSKSDIAVELAWRDLRIEQLIAQLEAAQKELSAANERTLAPVILEIANERLRQISVEGWTPEHDDQHSSGELAGAAGCYAKHVNARQWCFKNNPDDYQCEPEPSGWPWAAEWWKPKNPRSDLIRAAALIVAELERLDRAAGFTVEGE
ncbi:TPA: ead/Ea22-like family protein [Yersinia enterocolitica]